MASGASSAEHCASRGEVCPCHVQGPHPGGEPLTAPMRGPSWAGWALPSGRGSVPPVVGASAQLPSRHPCVTPHYRTRAWGHSPGHLSCHTCPCWKGMMADYLPHKVLGTPLPPSSPDPVRLPDQRARVSVPVAGPFSPHSCHPSLTEEERHRRAVCC